MQLVLDTNGLMVKKRNECFYIIGKKARRMISPVKIKSIAVLADCLISSSAIKLAARHAIPILFFNKSGKAESRLWSARFGSIATIRRKQVLFADQKEATQWLIQLFELKAKHQIDNLNFVKNRKPSLAIKLVAAIEKMEQYTTSFDSLKDKKPEACRNQFLGIEGSIAKAYWAQIALAMPENLTFEYRTRRPAKDPFNVLLNYGYGMLYGVIEGAVLAVGLDPHLGILHVDATINPPLPST